MPSKKILENPYLYIFAFWLFLFRPFHAFQLGGVLDDLCYFNFWFDIYKIPTQGACYLPKTYFPGVNIFWAPAALISFVAFKLLSLPFLNMYLALIGVCSFGAWAIAFRLSHPFLQKEFGLKTHQVLLLFLNVPVLYFCFQRTTLSHAGEFFFAVLTVLFVVRRQWGWASLFATFTALTRPNDCLVFLVLAAAFFETGRLSKKQIALVGLLVTLLLVPPLYIGLVKGYGQTFVLKVLACASLSELERLFFNRYYGFVWAAPASLAVLSCAALSYRSLTLKSWAVLLWFVAQFAVALGWTTGGGTNFNRYFIGVTVFLILVLRDIWKVSSNSRRQFLRFLLMVNGAYLGYLYWICTSRFAPFWAVWVDHRFTYFKALQHQFYSFSLLIQGVLGTLLITLTRIRLSFIPFLPTVSVVIILLASSALLLAARRDASP